MPKKINWRVYVRDHIYPQSVSAYMDLVLQKDVSRFPYYVRVHGVFSMVGPNFWWARDLDQIEKRFRFWITRWLKQPETLQSYLRAFKASQEKVRRATPVLKKKMISARTLTDAQVLQVFNEARSLFRGNITLSEYPVDTFDDFFGTLLAEQLSKVKNIAFTPKDRIALERPAYISVVMQYKLMLHKLLEQKNISERKIMTIAHLFSWIMMSWDGSHELTEAQVRKDLRKLSRRPLLKRKLERQKIQSYTKNILRERKRLFSRYHLPKKALLPYFELLDLFTALHDDRKECQMRSNQLIYLALREIARRFPVPFGDLMYYFNHEIEILCLRGDKIALKKIQSRRKGLTIVTLRNRITIYEGARAYRVVKRLVLDVLRSGKTIQLKGVPARHGIVRGKALVVSSAKEAIQRIRKGMVLITSMTTIDYVPAMHKAAAIVTDDGGLTCHAAIVSRELGVPCVVGTKTATQVFKTGDLVEVDANKGIMRKI